jgi:hypothetical protein
MKTRKKNKPEIRAQKSRKNSNFARYNKVQQLSKTWDPLPERKDIGKTKLKETQETKSNFINCSGGYFNIGKYKGVEVKSVPKWYLIWVMENIELNTTEKKLLTKYIKLETKVKKIQNTDLETQINTALSNKKINKWEYNFLQSIKGAERLSPKQTQTLHKIIIK